MQLVDIASPPPQGLDKVVWNTIASCNCDGTNAEAMARKIPGNTSGSHDLP